MRRACSIPSSPTASASPGGPAHDRRDRCPAGPEVPRGDRHGLDAARDGAGTERLDPGTQRIVVFSDHHKGTGDRADDFRRCEHAYSAALGYYLEQGYRLLVLGD